MNAWTVRCVTCAHRWNLVGNWSEYERQAMESRPCPKCGAYSLCCPEPTRPTAGKFQVSSFSSFRTHLTRKSVAQREERVTA